MIVYLRGALADPDTLAEVPNREHRIYEFEDLIGAADDAWQEAGYFLDGEFQDRFDAVDRERYPATQGDRWDFDDDEEIHRRYPRIVARFGD